jgi:hypothetical protein
LAFKGYKKKKLTDIGFWFGFPVGLLDFGFSQELDMIDT